METIILYDHQVKVWHFLNIVSSSLMSKLLAKIQKIQQF